MSFIAAIIASKTDPFKIILEVAKESEFDEPKYSYWQCSDFTNAAVRFLKDNNIEADTYSVKIQYKRKVGEHKPGDVEGHTFLAVGNRTYDYTLRQFDPSYSFPYIATLSASLYKGARKLEFKYDSNSDHWYELFLSKAEKDKQ